jgi:hypothetical protein
MCKQSQKTAGCLCSAPLGRASCRLTNNERKIFGRGNSPRMNEGAQPRPPRLQTPNGCLQLRTTPLGSHHQHSKTTAECQVRRGKTPNNTLYLACAAETSPLTLAAAAPRSAHTSSTHLHVRRRRRRAGGPVQPTPPPRRQVVRKGARKGTVAMASCGATKRRATLSIIILWSIPEPYEVQHSPRCL